MQKNIYKLLILFLILICATPCYADAGIPLWINNPPSFFAFTFLIGSTHINPLIIGLFLSFIILIVVTVIETGIIRVFLKNIELSNLLKIVFKSNLISAMVGSLIVLTPVPFQNSVGLNKVIFGPLIITGDFYPIVMFYLNIILLILSFFIEYAAAKKDLIHSYETKDIKKAFWMANIATYAMPLVLYGLGMVVTIIGMIMDPALYF